MRDAIAWEIACAVGQIACEVEQEVSDRMFDRINWQKTAYNRPEMTVEEIASAAADGFKVTEQ